MTANDINVQSKVTATICYIEKIKLEIWVCRVRGSYISIPHQNYTLYLIL